MEYCEAIEQVAERTKLLPSSETCVLVLTIAHNDMLSPGELGSSVVDVECLASEASQAQDVPASLVEEDAEAPPAALCSIARAGN